MVAGSGTMVNSQCFDCILTGTYAGIVTLCSFYGGVTVFRNAKFIGAHTLAPRNAISNSSSKICFENENRVAGANRVVQAYGDVEEVACNGTSGAPSVDPLSGNGKCLKVTPQPVCKKTWSFQVFDKHRLWCTAGTRTITYKVQSQFALASGDLTLVRTFMSAAGEEWTMEDDGAISSRSSDSDWSQQVQSSFTQAQDGWVIMALVMKKYDAAGSVFVWPTPTVT